MVKLAETLIKSTKQLFFIPPVTMPKGTVCRIALFKFGCNLSGKLHGNGWCYEQVCLAEMFRFSTNVIGKLAYSTC